MFSLAVLRMPLFGGAHHPYRDHVVPASVAHGSPNAVSGVNFDQRGLDTLGEESILLASVMGVTVLLRKADDEEERSVSGAGRILDLTTFGGYLLLPVTAIIGLDVITHGQLTPGGGFQGGVVVGTGLHLLYVAGRFRVLERLRPITAFEWGEAFGAAGFAVLGLAALGVSGAFLANVLPFGQFGKLFSSGTIALISGLVGIEVASGVMVLLAKFLEQALLFRRSRPASSDGGA